MAAKGISHLELTNFTAFAHLSMDLSPGINVLVGANSTGKTHVLKVMYDLLASAHDGATTGERLVTDFMPYDRRLSRLIHGQDPDGQARITIVCGSTELDCAIDGDQLGWWCPASAGAPEVRQVFLPAKEILAHAPGFRSLYGLRHIAFERLFADLIDRAFLPPLRVQTPAAQALLARLEGLLGGQVITRDETFLLQSDSVEIEFMLLAEGLRKLGLLWLLVRNGTLGEGAILFWDEPEANLNPRMLGEVVAALLALQEAGVQVFLATHSYVLLKEFDLRAGPEHEVRYHAFRRNDDDEVEGSSTAEFALISPNAILDAYGSLLDRQLAWPTEGVTS